MDIILSQDQSKNIGLVASNLRNAKLKGIHDAYIHNSKRKSCYNFKEEILSLQKSKKALLKKRMQLELRTGKEGKHYEGLLRLEIELQNSTCAVSSEIITQEAAIDRKKVKYYEELMGFQRQWDEVEKKYKQLPWVQKAESMQAKILLKRSELDLLTRKLKECQEFVKTIENRFEKTVIHFSKKMIEYRKLSAESRQLINWRNVLVSKIEILGNRLLEGKKKERPNVQRFVLYAGIGGDSTIDSVVSTELQADVDMFPDDYEPEQPSCLSLDISFDRSINYHEESAMSVEPTPAAGYIMTSTPCVPPQSEMSGGNQQNENLLQNMDQPSAQDSPIEKQPEGNTSVNSDEALDQKMYEKSPVNSESRTFVEETGNSSRPFGFCQREEASSTKKDCPFNFFESKEKEAAPSFFNLF